MPPTATRPAPANAPAAPPALVPFTAAAHEHTEPVFDTTVTPGAAATVLPTIDIPAYGFLRHLYFEVSGTGGALGTGVLGGDYPFNLFQSVALNDVNGAPIYGPYDGYATLWANAVGGYAFQNDPRRAPWYDGTLNAIFPLRVPVEISHHDGFGCLANQNSAASYKLNITINPFASMMSSVGTATAPAFRIRIFLEAWSLPESVDELGRPQAQFPPVHGTTQFWSQNIKNVVVGQQTVPLVRVGNLIRNVVFIARNASGVRANGVFPDPAQIAWDARSLLLDTQRYRQHLSFERENNLLALDTGVFAYSFSHADRNQVGDDNPTLWLPTVQATRLELNGVVATAGSIQILTNDVAPAEVIPAERYVEGSATGFHPAGVNSTAQ